MKKTLALLLTILGSSLVSCDKNKPEECSCEGPAIKTLKNVPMSFQIRGGRGFLYTPDTELSSYIVCDSTKLIPFEGVSHIVTENGGAYIAEFNLLVSGKVKCIQTPCSITGCNLGYLELTEVKSRP